MLNLYLHTYTLAHVLYTFVWVAVNYNRTVLSVAIATKFLQVFVTESNVKKTNYITICFHI